MDCRLAYFPIPAVHTALKEQPMDEVSPRSELPAILVSYVYLGPFLKTRSQFSFRDWSLDSGAFSAHQSDTVISLPKFTAEAKRLLEEDDQLVEVFALDVIGDHRASLSNTEYMWEQGVAAIPTYHIGEPESYLLHIARHYPKIALGGVARMKQATKIDFAQQCFARVWPKLVHGFGYGNEKGIMCVPWHSTDATNWELGPCAFGRWAAFGKMSVRGSNQNLRAEVEHYLALERKANNRWRKELALLGKQETALRLGLAWQRGTSGTQRAARSFTRKPRLVKKA